MGGLRKPESRLIEERRPERRLGQRVMGDAAAWSQGAAAADGLFKISPS